MNVLFLTMVKTYVDQRGLYSDLMRRFRNEGHNVYIVMPCERREGKDTSLSVELRDESLELRDPSLEKRGAVYTLSVRTLNVQKTNVIEKGLGQVTLEYLYMRAIKKYFGDVKFDLITYSTPPITFTKVIEWAKRNNPSAITYLQLKDIFPQNAVDLGMLAESLELRGERNKGESLEVRGERVSSFPVRFIKYMLYRAFRKKEEKLYRLSDYIGCMSPANVKYVIEHNPEVAVRQAQAPVVEICPNSFEPLDEMRGESLEVREGSLELSPSTGLRNRGESLEDDVNKSVRLRYNLPVDKPIFFYGGNLGKPQGIPFLVECLKANSDREDCHFIVVGSGTEYGLLESFINECKPKNVSLYRFLPKEDYDKLANACDVGLIFLDYRFTIPNYPSRLLACLMQRKPIIACTDPNCDTGTIAAENGYGMWAPSNNVEAFTEAVNKMLASDIKAMGEKGYQFYLNNYTDKHTYEAIMKHFV